MSDSDPPDEAYYAEEQVLCVICGEDVSEAQLASSAVQFPTGFMAHEKCVRRADTELKTGGSVRTGYFAWATAARTELPIGRLFLGTSVRPTRTRWEIA